MNKQKLREASNRLARLAGKIARENGLGPGEIFVDMILVNKNSPVGARRDRYYMKRHTGSLSSTRRPPRLLGNYQS